MEYIDIVKACSCDKNYKKWIWFGWTCCWSRWDYFSGELLLLRRTGYVLSAFLSFRFWIMSTSDLLSALIFLLIISVTTIANLLEECRDSGDGHVTRGSHTCCASSPRGVPLQSSIDFNGSWHRCAMEPSNQKEDPVVSAWRVYRCIIFSSLRKKPLTPTTFAAMVSQRYPMSVKRQSFLNSPSSKMTTWNLTWMWTAWSEHLIQRCILSEIYFMMWSRMCAKMEAENPACFQAPLRPVPGTLLHSDYSMFWNDPLSQHHPPTCPKFFAPRVTGGKNCTTGMETAAVTWPSHFLSSTSHTVTGTRVVWSNARQILWTMWDCHRIRILLHIWNTCVSRHVSTF